MESKSPESNVSSPLEWQRPVEEANGTHLVEVTEAAQVEVRRLLALEGKQGLRLGIKGGGCSGLSYMLEFTEQREGDTVLAFSDFVVFLDPKSTLYLSGVTLDFQSGLKGRGFVFENPQASNTCGCGESFSL